MRSPSLGVFVLAAVFSGGCDPGDPNGPSPFIGVQSVTLSPPSATIPAGSSIQLSVSVLADASTSKTVSWTSSSSSVALIDQNGKVTGVGEGTATIIATSTVDPTKAAASVIRVEGPALPTILITSINGNYSGSGTADTNTCGFSANAAATGVMTVSLNGDGTWVIRHIAADVTFTEAIKAILTNSTTGAATFTGSTTQTIGGQAFSVSDSGTVSGNTINDTQTLTRQGSSPCTVRYNFVFTKQ